jgi:DNA-binding CsgD family transcriptional regulator
LGDITSDYSGASRAGAKKRLKRSVGQLPSGKIRNDFGLLRLERQIIALTVEGNSSEEIAKSIGMNESALGVQLTSIYQKLHVSNQFELILFAVYHQLIETCD